MKKNVLLLLMILLAFTACEGPQGPPGEPGILGLKIIDISIDAEDWVISKDNQGLNAYYMCEVNVPELSRTVYQDGLVHAYLVQNPGTSYEVETSLNCSFPNENQYGDLWTEYYSWDYMPGSVAFYVKYSDFNLVPGPGDKLFKLVLLW
ncbi:hypothetical protein D0T51_06945 [Parabacteroides sp. 52]|uniref:hypothetical protein n=1 Tax=unclassified Parabacteroides TaxID=2649774 RepID=UPI0013CF7B1E|nr:MULTISPECIES: hypothetical protein [unclassified Parabacteroides]MDH6535599.1 hypothetical protein [Parabacteroides sp. PM5-20]NDV55464.1 hypothetical protein [Parabacteroides sp. 52]